VEDASTGISPGAAAGIAAGASLAALAAIAAAYYFTQQQKGMEMV